MSVVSSTQRLLRVTPLAAALACAFAATEPAYAAHGQATTTAPRYAARLEVRRQRAARIPVVAARAAAPAGNTLPVLSCGDDADDAGTLRNVLATAVEGDTVDLSALTCSTITLTQGPIDTSALGEHQLYDVTLQGPGRSALTIDGGNASQVLTVGGFSSDKGTFTANDLTIANGSYGGSLAACIEGFGGAVVLNRVDVTNCHSTGTYDVIFAGAVDVTTLTMTDSTITNSSAIASGTYSTVVGGGAYASDSMTLVRSTISGNSASAPYADHEGYTSVGGGAYSRGNLALTDSTVSGNSIEATADGQNARGGGIYVRGIATITGSTIDGNSADGDGGGVYKAVYSVYGEPGGPNPTTSLTVVDSTLSGNISDAGGGGIAISRPLYLRNSTVADNQATLGGAGVLFRTIGPTDAAAVLELTSSIVATNTAADGASFAADIDADATATVTSGHSLVQAAGTAVALPAGTLADDPLLLPLADNGGATRTHALRAGSPAIDTGDNPVPLDFDQRGTGFARVSGAAADIGAFEIQQPPADGDLIFKDGFDGAAAGTPFEYVYDDGNGDTNQGPPSTFDPDMLWGNYFLAQPGGEIVTHLSVAFGPTFPSLANGQVTFWLLEDEDADLDPRNAHAIASVAATPDVFNDNFYQVEISPTYVHGGFFVGASAKLQGGQDRPARVDTNAAGDKSWFFYAPDITATIDDLAAAPYGTRMDGPDVILPGAFMVRAEAASELP